METPKTPELDKLIKVSEESQSIGQFLEWLQGSGYQVCLYDRKAEDFWPTHESINDLLARYFDIDLAKVDKERRAVLEYVRETQNG